MFKLQIVNVFIIFQGQEVQPRPVFTQTVNPQLWIKERRYLKVRTFESASLCIIIMLCFVEAAKTVGFIQHSALVILLPPNERLLNGLNHQIPYFRDFDMVFKLNLSKFDIACFIKTRQVKSITYRQVIKIPIYVQSI